MKPVRQEHVKALRILRSTGQGTVGTLWPSASAARTSILIYKDGKFTRIASPDDYGRIVNQAGSEAFPVLLWDYESGPETGLEPRARLPHRHRVVEVANGIG
jgi:hypothetical protein